MTLLNRQESGSGEQAAMEWAAECSEDEEQRLQKFLARQAVKPVVEAD